MVREMYMQDLVTIVTPSWNSAKYIEETIRSVQAQTYENWEMIIVDDCSTDNSVEIVKRIAAEDPRVKILVQDVNGGAAKARTRSMQTGTGRFVAYLDADDIWKPEKLEKQIAFMKTKQCGFSCTSYEVIDDKGKPKNKYIHMLPKVNYIGFLTNNLLQTVGIMVDTSIVDKKYLIMPDLRRRQDAATWLQILKAGYECYGLDEILAEYRRAENSLSSNKFKAAKGIWSLYRDVEHLSFPFSCYCFVRYAFLAVWKRLYKSERSLTQMGKINDVFKECFKLITRPLNDETYLKLSYRMIMKKRLDLDNPKTLNEKLQWVKLYNHDPLLTKYVDKYLVKDIVADVIGNEYIIPTLGMWKHFEDIDFSKLPNQFVLKCNHDSHSVVVCKDKKNFNYKSARKKLNKGLKKNYYWHGREWAYKNVSPCIIAEKYMSDNEQTSELTDYKFYCFGEYVDSVMLCIDRDIDNPKYYFFDKDWNLRRYNVRGKEAPEDFTLPKPPRMDEMFELASKLSKFTKAPYVRVDLYNVNGQPYFGELTFSPNNGLDPNRLYETDLYFGNLTNLEVVKR